MTLEATHENTHAAAMIRLQTLFTALQDAIPTLENAAYDDQNPNQDDARDALANARAALAVAMGKSTEIPDALRRSRTLADPQMTTRFLEIPLDR